MTNTKFSPREVGSGLTRSSRRTSLRWTPEFRAAIAEHYQSKTIAELAALTGRSYRQVDGYLYAAGLYSTRKTIKRANLRGISKLSATDWAYIAGIIDGEGTVSVALREPRYFRPHVTIATTTLALVEYFERFGFYGVFATNSDGRMYWRVTISGFSVADFLRGALPHLIIKREHAELLIELCDLRLSARWRAPTPLRMFEIYSIIRDWNTRGSRLLDDLRRRNLCLTSSRRAGVTPRMA